MPVAVRRTCSHCRCVRRVAGVGTSVGKGAAGDAALLVLVGGLSFGLHILLWRIIVPKVPNSSKGILLVRVRQVLWGEGLRISAYGPVEVAEQIQCINNDDVV